MADPTEMIAHNKLIILYLLKKSDMDLSELQIMRIMDELSLMRYFDLKESIFELEQNGHIYSSAMPQALLYGITEAGLNIINVLENDLRLSFRNSIDDYLHLNKNELKKESQYKSDYIKIGDGEYRVALKVLEKSSVIFEINVVVYSRDEAEYMVSKWQDNAVAVYKDLLIKLST